MMLHQSAWTMIFLNVFRGLQTQMLFPKGAYHLFVWSFSHNTPKMVQTTNILGGLGSMLIV